MPAALPEETLADLTTALDVWTRDRIHALGYFYVKDASRHLAQRLGHRGGLLNGQLMRKLLARLGDCESLGSRHGYRRRGISSRPLTLSTLLALAEEHTVRDGSYTPRAGEQATRDVHRLTPGQLATVRAAAELAAEMIAGDSGDLAGVGPENLGWDATAGKGARGDWALVARVAAYSDETARHAHVKRRSARVPFDRASNGARREKHVGGIRRLLDLAATYGQIQRGEAQGVARVPDEGWTPPLAEWGRILGGSSATVRRSIARGCRTLALFSTRRGWRNDTEVDWPVLIASIDAAYADGRGSLKHDAWTWARRAYNELCDRGIIVGSRWAVRGDSRVTLVPARLVTKAASTGEFSNWTTPAGVVATALTTGDMGLADWWRWATLPTPDEVRLAGLPPREYANPTEREKIKVARNGGKAFRLGPKTMEGRVSDFAWHAGWCAKELGIDWSQNGADELCNPVHLEAHKVYRARAEGRAVGTPDSLLSKAAQALATLASPYLEGRALQHAAEARAEGDTAQAAAHEARAVQLKGWSGDLKANSVALQAKKRGQQRDGESITKREVRDLWLAWSADGTSGWTKLRRLRDLLVGAAEREFARCLYVQVPNKKHPAKGPRLMRDPEAPPSVPIVEQIAWIRREGALPAEQRRFRPSQSWAVLVRDASVFTIQYHIPLRERNVVGMRRHNWVAEARGSASAVRAGAAAVQPWEGEIHLLFDSDEMKSDRGFNPLLLAAAHRSTPGALASVRPDLLELYWMSGGARDEVLRLHATAAPVTLTVRAVTGSGTVEETTRTFGPGDVIPSDYVFPSCARKGGRSASDREAYTARLQAGSPWDEGSFASRWRDLLEDYADDIGIEFERVAALFGGAAPHVARHLAGTHHCDPNQPDGMGAKAISVLLHHASEDITKAKYVGVSERQIAVSSHAKASHQPLEAVVSVASGARSSTAAAAAPTVPTGGEGDPFVRERDQIMARYRDRKIDAQRLATLLQDVDDREREARSSKQAA